MKAMKKQLSKMVKYIRKIADIFFGFTVVAFLFIILIIFGSAWWFDPIADAESGDVK